MRRYWSLGVSLLLSACGAPELSESEGDSLLTSRAALEAVSNREGVAETAHLSGTIDRSNPFFENLGTNGRTCETCHDGRSAWTTSVEVMNFQFESTGGTHPLFVSLHDSGNRPDADVSTLSEKRKAFSTLLEHGVHRFTRSVPATANYEIIAVDDPYGWSTPASFASFRRAGTNMGFLSRVASSTTTAGPHVVRTNAVNLMNGATGFHAQTTVPVAPAKRELGADFMMGLAFAQSVDDKAGPLDADGARGGPYNLLNESYPVVGKFDLYDAWEDADRYDHGRQALKRAQIARGQKLFNTMEFDVSGVAGLNDVLGQPVIRTTCSGCHRAKNVGSSTSFITMNIGTTSEEFRPSWLPLITARHKTTGEILRVTDIGRAQNSQQFADLGKVRVLGLRGLASRAPYFHNGSAKDIKAVLKFYEERFSIDMNGRDREDLEAFLLAL